MINPVSFQPGDLLVLYTDGVTDAENRSHEFFGSERLIAMVKESSGEERSRDLLERHSWA